jgi:hypothetical protein
LTLVAHNYGTDAIMVGLDLIFTKGDTVPDYHNTQRGFIYAGDDRRFGFAPWDASPGEYFGRYVILSDTHVIRDTVRWHFVVSTAGIEEGNGLTSAHLLSSAATIMNGTLRLPAASSPGNASIGRLLDIAGKVVLSLRSGSNDVSGLAPGVYFVRLVAPGSEKSKKVVLE